MIANMVNSDTIVPTTEESNEYLKYTFSITSIGDSGITLYYCTDNNDECNPNIEVDTITPSATHNPGDIFIYLDGTYYFRYKLVTGSGISSDIYSYKAVVDLSKHDLDPEQEDENIYKIISGDKQVVNFKKDDKLMFKVDADVTKFVSLYKSNFI